MHFETIALFGANGQIGQRILERLSHNPTHNFTVRAFIPPDDDLACAGNDHKTVIKSFDPDDSLRQGLARDLEGADVVISALSGRALDAQPLIQDAAADAGVKRFYPSEYGMHLIYRKPDDPWGYLHPVWHQKAQLNERVTMHPAVLSGKMTYTIIGCGDFYDRDREPIWCPWTQPDLPEYTIHVIGDPQARADFTHMDDFAEYLAATLVEPAKSENQVLNFVSTTVSYMEIADALRNSTGKTVKIDYYPATTMHDVVADPTKAPPELGESALPIDFWFVVKGLQGQGRFRRPRGQINNHLFPHVKPTTFDTYFQQKFGDA
ncbi:nad-binding protein [Diplodia corticola]|uniref:Nad-binding protein n=1 Tax=Diplodia corticola TaxID=236234 RepID=A0A1J9RGM1_9PEZI|nr:nad-binding protein [Diplodia corticola]OJD31683.1 nad-binding protein [Diplodia corticola]